MSELNANEIIRAYECCHSLLYSCEDCPFDKDNEACCNLAINTLALLKSQEERIKKLSEKNDRLRKSEITYETPLGKQTMPNLLHLEEDAARLYTQIESKIKANIVRKMQEEVKAQCRELFSGLDVCMIVDKIANELIEEGKK